MKKFNIIGDHWKFQFLGGGGCMKNQYIEGEFPKNEGLESLQI